MKVKRTREVLKRETHPGGGETLSRGVKGEGVRCTLLKETASNSLF